jgi:hypothetical protein
VTRHFIEALKESGIVSRNNAMTSKELFTGLERDQYRRGNKPPKDYFNQLAAQCFGGKMKYGAICDPD